MAAMGANWAATVVIAFAVAASGAHGLAAQADSTTSVERFKAAITEYVALHRQVERYTPPQKIFTDPAEAERSMKVMADAMRRMRPNAREGDIFNAEVANVFRREILQALDDSGFDVGTLLEQTIPETTEQPALPTVNGQFSWALGNTMPPCVLLVLPELPIELQYRFVGTDLVLIDLHANLVVDILRGALPEDDATRDRRRCV